MAFPARNRSGRGCRPAHRSWAVAAWRSGRGGSPLASARRLVGRPRAAVASSRPPGCRPRAGGHLAWCRSRVGPRAANHLGAADPPRVCGRAGVGRSRTGSGRGCPARSARRPRTAACRTAMPVVATNARRRVCRHGGHRRIRPAGDRRMGPATGPGRARPPRACRGGPRGDRSIRWPRERWDPARRRMRQAAMPSRSRSRCPGRETAGSPTCWCGTRRGRVAVGPRQPRWSRKGWEVPAGRWAGRSPGAQRNRCSGGRTDPVRRPRCRRASATAPTPTRDRRGAGWRAGPVPDRVACPHHPRAPAGRVPWPSRSNAPSGRHAFARGGRTPLVQSGSNR
jgi:hypothetical protein